MNLDSISVLLVEDDVKLARLTTEYLLARGLQVTHVTDGRLGLEAIRQGGFDVALLDVGLPHHSGLELCRALRAHSDVPILLITARDEEADRVVGLDGGADDYLVKPFSPRELLARIQAQVRRARGLLKPPDSVLQVGGLKLNPQRHEAQLKGQRLDLTAYEFALLRVLAESAGRVLSREQLMSRLGTSEESFDRAIDVHVSRLRKKLGDDPKRPRMLKTVRGSGYVLSDGEDA